MRQERGEEARKHREATRREAEVLRQKRETLDSIQQDLAHLFALEDAHRRGIALEDILNRLFRTGWHSRTGIFHTDGRTWSGGD